MEKYKDVANDMERMHNEDRQKWGGEMKPKFYAALEHVEANSNFLWRWGAFRRFRQAAIAAEKAHDKLRAAIEAA